MIQLWEEVENEQRRHQALKDAVEGTEREQIESSRKEFATLLDEKQSEVLKLKE